MSEHSPASDFIALFPTEDVPRIIQNIQNCCALLKRQEDFEKENSLSKRLYLHLCLLPEYRRGPIAPLWESWLVNLTDVNAEITGRADILFLCGGIETYFLLEAKRLFVTYPGGNQDSLVKEYIKDGMMRFVSGQYASKMTEGAMLGYVCDNTVPIARSALSAEVAKQAVKLQLAGNGAWQESGLAVTPSVDETRHALSNREFTMYHILTKV
jgi:hypothetical protein